jgi:hypothetical protein
MNSRTPTHGFDPVFWVFVPIWLAILVLTQKKLLWRLIQRYRAKSWPIASGQIESVAAIEPKQAAFSLTAGRYAPASLAEIFYSYSVGGEREAGRYDREFATAAEAREFLRELKGKSVAVHYNPNKPSSSALSEPSIESLTQARAPNPDAENLRYAPENSLPLWSRPLLWLFAALSAFGLIASLFAYIGAIAGRNVVPEELSLVFRAGIFVLMLPLILVTRRRAGSRRRKGYRKILLHGAPDWMRYMVYGFSAFALIDVFHFMSQAPNAGGGANSPLGVWRGLPGTTIAFYADAFAIFYAAAIDMGNLQRCVNGHPVPLGASFCERCGQPVVRIR